MDIETGSAERIRKAAWAIQDILDGLGMGVTGASLSIHPTGLSMDLHGVSALDVVSALPGCVRKDYIADGGRSFVAATADVDGAVTVTGYGK